MADQTWVVEDRFCGKNEANTYITKGGRRDCRVCRRERRKNNV